MDSGAALAVLAFMYLFKGGMPHGAPGGGYPHGPTPKPKPRKPVGVTIGPVQTPVSPDMLSLNIPK